LKRERWGSPLVQEMYREGKASDKRHDNDNDNNNNNNYNNNNICVYCRDEIDVLGFDVPDILISNIF
jgi:hypothetical protein